MGNLLSKCLLALAVLQGVIPADHCILKLAGMCSCDAPAKNAAVPDCCQEMKSSETSRSNPCPSAPDQNKPCCAVTPAHGLTADVQPAPFVDLHQDCLPTALISAIDALLTQTTEVALAPRGQDSPQPFDTPLYLRAHSFLI